MYNVTKSDFRRYLECKKNAWLFKHRQDLFPKTEEESFRDLLAKQGYEVEAYARKLFPTGVTVEGFGEAALSQTKDFIADEKNVIFQATIEADDFLVMVDVLEKSKDGTWIIHEVKSTTEKKETSAQKKLAIKDIAFQKLILEKAGFVVVQTSLIELDKEFRKNGGIDPHDLLKKTDITETVVELMPDLIIEADNAKQYLSRKEEPNGNCDCILSRL